MQQKFKIRVTHPNGAVEYFRDCILGKDRFGAPVHLAELVPEKAKGRVFQNGESAVMFRDRLRNEYQYHAVVTDLHDGIHFESGPEVPIGNYSGKHTDVFVELDGVNHLGRIVRATHSVQYGRSWSIRFKNPALAHQSIVLPYGEGPIAVCEKMADLRFDVLEPMETSPFIEQIKKQEAVQQQQQQTNSQGRLRPGDFAL
jgi:hypothetical protein